MYVINVIGYDFSFKYNGVEGKAVIKIPFNQIFYRVPDDIHDFNELREVHVMNPPKPPELDVAGLSKVEKNLKNNEKPLKRIKINKNKRKELIKTRT